MLLLSDATLLPVPPAWLGTTAELRSFAGPADASGALADVAIDLAPALPLAPVHLAAVRGVTGDIAFSWMRRSRADTDGWAADDAPLDYAPETYRLVVFNGITAVRTIDIATPSAIYTAIQQTTDFGAPPASFSFTVAQKSPLYGPGPATTAIFTA